MVCQEENMKNRLSDKYRLPRPSRLPDQVAAILIQEIKRGVLKPDDMLPSEAELSAKFNVSRSVIREALSQLKYEGLLDSRQGKGITVVGTSGRRFFHLENLSKLTPRELAQLYELRSILEGEAAAKAARRRSKKSLARLKSCLKEMAKAVDSDTSGTMPDLDFHKGIAEASGNSHLRDLMQFLNEKLLFAIEKARGHSRLKPGLPKEVQKEHEAIFQAIEAQDPELAREKALTHLRNAARRLGLRIPD